MDDVIELPQVGDVVQIGKSSIISRIVSTTVKNNRTIATLEHPIYTGPYVLESLRRIDPQDVGCVYFDKRNA